MPNEHNTICKKHSGIQRTLDEHDRNISQLWDKWDNMQKLVIGIFVVVAMNLLGVIFMLLR